MEKDKIAKELSVHTEKLDSLEEVAAVHTEKLETLKDIASELAKRSLDHEKDIKEIKENMFTKQDANQLFVILDKHSAILERLDQERISANEILKRHDKRLDSHDTEIGKIKEALKAS